MNDPKKINPSDSAFPWSNEYNQAHGLTIRAYLAGKAMHGFISNGHIDDDFCAIRSLEMADALIARLNKDL